MKQLLDNASSRKLFRSCYCYRPYFDCSVSEVIRISELEESKLQQEIDNVTQWSSANNMKLNVKKTEDFTVSFLHSQFSVEPF